MEHEIFGEYEFSMRWREKIGSDEIERVREGEKQRKCTIQLANLHFVVNMYSCCCIKSD